MTDFCAVAGGVGIDGDNCPGAPQGRQPAIHAALLFFPTNFAAGAIAGQILMAFVFELADRANECVTPVLGVNVARRREVGKLAEAASDEMLERKAGSLGFVRDYGAD